MGYLHLLPGRLDPLTVLKREARPDQQLTPLVRVAQDCAHVDPHRVRYKCPRMRTNPTGTHSCASVMSALAGSAKM